MNAARETREVRPLSRIFPTPKKREQTTRTSVTLPNSIWARLKEISEEELEEDGSAMTRDRAAEFLLRWAINEYDAEKKTKK